MTPKALGAALLILGVRRVGRIAGFGLELKRRQRVEIPVWVGAIATLAGGALLAAGAKGSRRKD